MSKCHYIKRLPFCLLLLATALPTYLHAQDTISAGEMTQRYEMYQKGALKPSSITADEVVYNEYRKRKKGDGRWTWNGSPYRYSLVNDLRTSEYLDKRHFWSFVAIRHYPLLGKRTRFRKRFYRAIKHGRKPSKRARRYTMAPRPEFLSLDSIDGMKREEWEKTMPKPYIMKFKRMDYAQGITRELKLLDEPFYLLGYPVSIYRTLIDVKEGRITNYGKDAYSSVRDHGELWDISSKTMDASGKRHLQKAMIELSRAVNEKVKAEKAGKRFALFIKHVPGGKAIVEPIRKQDSSDSDFRQLAQALESMGDNYYPRFWTVGWKILPGLIVEAEFTADNGWIITLPEDKK